MNEFYTCEHGANHGNGESCDCVTAELATPTPDALIVIEQLPVITEQFRLAGAEVARRVAEADALICTEESKQTVKSARAHLNKERKDFEARFKEVEAQVLEPWNQVVAAYKEHIITPYADGDKKLKDKIDTIEDEQKRQKIEEVRAYFEEYAASLHLDPYFINWEFTKINVTLSASEKSLKAQAKDYVDLRIKHLESIEKREHAAEILVEYRQSLRVMDAIEAVEKRHRLLAEQERRKAELETVRAAEAETVKRVEAVASLAPPTVKSVEKDPIRTVAFKVTAPLSKLRELKKYLVDGGYEFE